MRCRSIRVLSQEGSGSYAALAFPVKGWPCTCLWHHYACLLLIICSARIPRQSYAEWSFMASHVHGSAVRRGPTCKRQIAQKPGGGLAQRMSRSWPAARDDFPSVPQHLSSETGFPHESRTTSELLQLHPCLHRCDWQLGRKMHAH